MCRVSVILLSEEVIEDACVPLTINLFVVRTEWPIQTIADLIVLDDSIPVSLLSITHYLFANVVSWDFDFRSCE